MRTHVDSSPAVADDTTVVGGVAGIHAFDASDGDERWATPASLVPASGFGDQQEAERVLSSPAIAGGSAYVGTDSGVRALALDGGEDRWTYHTDAHVAASPAVADGIESDGEESTGVLVVDRSGTLYALV